MTDTERKHSPLPWHINGDFIVKEDDSWVLAFLGTCNPDDDRANAAFIVTACNSHYDLKAENERLKAESEKLANVLWEAQEFIADEYQDGTAVEDGEWLDPAARPIHQKICSVVAEYEVTLSQAKGEE